MSDLIERLNDAWRKLYGDGDEHDVCDTIAEAAAALEAAREEVEEMQRRLDREESDHGRTIDQRDAAEDALGRMFQAVTGRTAEWSSAWGYVDAIEEVEEHVATLATERDQLAAALEAAREDAERLRTDGASAVRWAPGSAYWSEVLVELFGPDARKGIDVLEARWRKEIERAERLAEALRGLEEREQRDEALLRQALEALGRAHQTAMEQTLRARVPECAEFAGIAQDLDFVITALRERLGEGT